MTEVTTPTITPQGEEGAPEALTQEELDAIHAVHNSEQEEQGHDNHGHNDDHHHHSDEFHWYSRPRQRQKWGECKSMEAFWLTTRLCCCPQCLILSFRLAFPMIWFYWFSYLFDPVGTVT